MLRALSCRKAGWSKYERLEEEEEDDDEVKLFKERLKRNKSLPAQALGSLKKITTTTTTIEEEEARNIKKVKKINKANKGHPLFSLFYGKGKKKPSSSPEFARYLQYIKEGGIWDANSTMPVIYYK